MDIHFARKIDCRYNNSTFDLSPLGIGCNYGKSVRCGCLTSTLFHFTFKFWIAGVAIEIFGTVCTVKRVSGGDCWFAEP